MLSDLDYFQKISADEGSTRQQTSPLFGLLVARLQQDPRINPYVSKMTQPLRTQLI